MSSLELCQKIFVGSIIGKFPVTGGGGWEVLLVNIVFWAVLSCANEKANMSFPKYQDIPEPVFHQL